MTLLQQLKADTLLARKQKHGMASFMVTLYAEAIAVGKNKRNSDSTDEEVISVLKRFKVGAETIIQAATSQSTPNSQLQINQAKMEIFIVEQYLPKMMSAAELKSAIIAYHNHLTGKAYPTTPTMGMIMGHLKQAYPGMIDGGIASTLIKEILTR